MEYYIWLGTMDPDWFHAHYWDNEPYETALRMWEEGLGPKPEDELKCGFCREMGLGKLSDDHWFSVSASPRAGSEMLGIYTEKGLDAFAQACREKGVLEVTVIWGLSQKACPQIDPVACKSLTYIGVFSL